MIESNNKINKILKLNEMLDKLAQTNQVLLVKSQINEIFKQNLTILLFKLKDEGKEVPEGPFKEHLQKMLAIL